MGAIAETLRHDLRDPEFAEVYGENFLDTYVATQIKVLREQREMTQAQLAAQLGTTQTVISRIEKVNYSSWNITTLKRLAKAFGVRLSVSFETYGSLLDDMERFSRTSLERAPIDRDPELYAPHIVDIAAFRALGARANHPNELGIMYQTKGQDVSRETVASGEHQAEQQDATKIRRLTSIMAKPAILKSLPNIANQSVQAEAAYGR